MDLEIAEGLARELIEKHVPTYRFGWTNRKTLAGLCDYRGQTIYLSRFTTAGESVEQVLDTILHEIAHAIAGSGAGHGREWREVAVRLGARPRASYVGTRLDAPWRGTCPAGHASKARYYRKPRKNYSCSQCSPTYNPAHIISWRKVDITPQSV